MLAIFLDARDRGLNKTEKILSLIVYILFGEITNQQTYKYSQHITSAKKKLK